MPRFVSPGLRNGKCVALLVLASMLGYAGAANAGMWHPGQLTTYGASLWGGPPSNPGPALLAADLATVYASVGGVILGTPKYAEAWVDVPSLLNYLPPTAPYGPLTTSQIDPTSDSSGAFGQNLLALKLNVDFSDAGFLPGTSGQRFGDLKLTGFSGPFSQLNNMSVSHFLADMNTLISGASSIVDGISISDVGTYNAAFGDALLPALNDAFSSGVPSQFAQDHLANAVPWQTGDLTTYGASLWGGPPSNPGPALLAADLATVYGSVGGVILGTPKYAEAWVDVPSLLNYLPPTAPYGPLTTSQIDPTSDSSGAFGQNLLALKLNVDFSDAGFLPGTSGLPFGDLDLTNFSGPFSQLNNMSVSHFLADMNTLISGASSIVDGISISDVGTYNAAFGNALLPALNDAFSSGFPSQFAQDHLVAPAVQAVPEPSSWVLLGSGPLGLVAIRRWKRRH